MRATCAVIALTLSLALAPQVRAQDPVAPVAGVILDNHSGTGAPGLTAYLIHPVLGRSAPTLTDADGHFGWSAIPMRSEPYYLEIYWGTKLIYRQQLMVPGPVRLPPLRL
ncbi:MAG: hypothetical protein ACJ8DC_04455 [Gemmatimonadales bacterium]